MQVEVEHSPHGLWAQIPWANSVVLIEKKKQEIKKKKAEGKRDGGKKKDV